MQEVSIIFPNQLFKDSKLIDLGLPIYLVEENLFFNQYNFHKQKIAFHRASMQAYKAYLNMQNLPVEYISAIDPRSNIKLLIHSLGKVGVNKIHLFDPVDNWLEKHIGEASNKNKIKVTYYENTSYINRNEELKTFFRTDKKKFFQTSFYIAQRKKLKILLDDNGEALGGKWSYDAENRKKYPRKKLAPSITFPDKNKFHEEATTYVEKHFNENYGELSENPIYPIDFNEAEKWLDQFLINRFHEFGTYEDAIVSSELILNHSVFSPLINVGLLHPLKVVKKAIDYAVENQIPINSTEGFVRQIIGWREFIRGVYQAVGTKERTRNYWNFNKKIPDSFYDGTTGILPVDTTIRKVLKTGYCHHIERLMILGNFMMLCEFDPDEVYRWFMEMFIDAYDWVMVPNIYGMSQFSDGGLMSTKPYISGSNYVLKMSNYGKGEWQKTWDGLFWRFMDLHREFFLKNPRLGMLVRSFDKMDENKKRAHIENAESFLSKL